MSYVILGFLHLAYLDSYLQGNKKISYIFGKLYLIKIYSILYLQEIEFRLHLIEFPNILVWPLKHLFYVLI